MDWNDKALFEQDSSLPQLIQNPVSSESIHNDADQPVIVWWQVHRKGDCGVYGRVHPGNTTDKFSFQIKGRHQICINHCGTWPNLQKPVAFLGSVMPHGDDAFHLRCPRIGENPSIDTFHEACKDFPGVPLAGEHLVYKVSEILSHLSSVVTSTTTFAPDVEYKKVEDDDSKEASEGVDSASDKENKKRESSNAHSSSTEESSSTHEKRNEEKKKTLAKTSADSGSSDGSSSSDSAGRRKKQPPTRVASKKSSSTDSSESSHVKAKLYAMKFRNNQLEYFTSGLISLASFMLAYICLKKFCIFQKLPQGFQEPLMNT